MRTQLIQPTTEVSIPKLALTVDETGQALGLSAVTVYRLIARGQLKSSGALRHKVIPVVEVERFLRDTLK